MNRRVPLSDEENYAIFTDTFGDSLSDLDRNKQVQVLKRLLKLLESDAPQRYIYETVEGTDELEVVRAGDTLRIYCRLVMGVPHGNQTYNVLFVFYVDEHRYANLDLERFDNVAAMRLHVLTDFDDVDDITAYLKDHNAKQAGFLREQLDRA